ncbi:MAG: sigma-70 family RNA polymerase sigma factor [Oscillospiraceae bacterium]|nr:sigma-70 family RNA polymerase sigma factor [Oscillospiraceae bacterium]MBQ9111268.1 sigma-70 family RNA polymerase sigma factor [Oscillospiraceae bacterium]
MTDSELCKLIQTDPEQGHKALYETYVKYVYAIIFRILREIGSPEDIEDCLVETFSDVILHLGSIEGGQYKSYIGQSARNRALNYYNVLRRQKEHTIPAEEIAEPSVLHVQEELEQKELRNQLLQRIKALGEPDATILIQKYYYGRKMSEIGKLVGLTANAAQVRCSRALKRLQKELADWR